MILEKRYTDQQLEKIVDEATIYMCACPAQVAVQLRHLRALFLYQHACQSEPGNEPVVHQTIAAATLRAHALMEDCLGEVLAIEGWDPLTLTMPEGLRRKRTEMLGRDD